jgi:hypothetical protein
MWSSIFLFSFDHNVGEFQNIVTCPQMKNVSNTGSERILLQANQREMAEFLRISKSAYSMHELKTRKLNKAAKQRLSTLKANIASILAEDKEPRAKKMTLTNQELLKLKLILYQKQKELIELNHKLQLLRLDVEAYTKAEKILSKLKTSETGNDGKIQSNLISNWKMKAEIFFLKNTAYNYTMQCAKVASLEAEIKVLKNAVV